MTAVRAVTLLACSPRSERGGRAIASCAPNRLPAGEADHHSLHRFRHARFPLCFPDFPRRLCARDRCPNTPLKLTLPIHRLAGRFSPTRFI